MNQILKISRETVKFNPNFAHHRKWYYDFLKTKSWSECPVRFVIEDNFVDVPSCIEYKLLNYYMSKDSFRGVKNER